MKKWLKIGGFTAGTVAILTLVFLLVFPVLFHDRIEREIKTLANRSLKSELDFSGISLSFFRHFPHLTLTIRDFSLQSAPPFPRDTLIAARDVSLGVDVASLFGDTIRINRIYFDEARINILYNEQGAASYEVYREQEAALPDKEPADSAAGASLSIRHIVFRNCRVTYSDPSIPLRVTVNGFNYEGASRLDGHLFNLTSDVNIDSLDLVFNQVKYLDAKPVRATLSTRVNTRDLVVDLEKNDLKIKDIPLEFQGKFRFAKTGYELNLNFLSVMEKEFLSARFRLKQEEQLWVSAKVNASIDLGRWSKAFDLRRAEVRGLYELNLDAEGTWAMGTVPRGPRNVPDTVVRSIPKFSLQSTLTGGYFRHTSLPRAIDTLAFRLDIACPDSDYRHISAAINQLKARFSDSRIEGSARVGNLLNYPVEADFSAHCNLADLMQVVPVDSLSVSGLLDLRMKASGSYEPERKKFPVLEGFLLLKEGTLRTPWYPSAIEKVTVDLQAVCRDGITAGVTAEVKDLTFLFEGQPFRISGRVENLDDPSYSITANGTADLGRISRVFSPRGLSVEGFLDANLSLKGKKSEALAGRFSAADNKGTLLVRDLRAGSDYFPLPFFIRTGTFRFAGDRVSWENVQAVYGRSDFRLRGSVFNLAAYLLGSGIPLKGRFNLVSDRIDVDQFMAFSPPADSDSAVADTGKPGVILLPPDLDLQFDARIKKVGFRGLEIDDLRGSVNLKKEILALKETSFTLIGCRVTMDASYGSVTPEKAYFDFHLKADEFDIKKAWNEVTMIREMIPSAERVEGIVSLDYKIKGMLDPDMMPLLPGLEGGGTLTLKKVKVHDLKMFNDLSRGTGKESLKDPDLSKVEIRSTIAKNTVTLEQFRFKVKGIRLRVSGTTTFDQRMNLRMRIGLGPFGIIGIPLKVTGTADNPRIRYGKGEDETKLDESELSDQLPAEMLERIKNAKESDDDNSPE